MGAAALGRTAIARYGVRFGRAHDLIGVDTFAEGSGVVFRAVDARMAAVQGLDGTPTRGRGRDHTMDAMRTLWVVATLALGACGAVNDGGQPLATGTTAEERDLLEGLERATAAFERTHRSVRGTEPADLPAGPLRDAFEKIRADSRRIEDVLAARGGGR